MLFRSVGLSIPAITLINLMAGIESPTEGNATFKGTLITGPGPERGVIFQSYSLMPWLTVTGNVRLAVDTVFPNLSKAERAEKTARYVKMVGLSHAASRRPAELSGGMRQRVMIAMGLACNPKLLIADEPTTALDVTIQAQIVELVKRLKAELNMAVIWITHDLSLLASLADRILVMYAGQIVESASLDQLYANPRHPYTLGLLQSIPRLDEAQKAALKPVDGMPPDLTDYPPGCPFAARCPYVIDRCHTEDPTLEAVGDNHAVACWVKPNGAEVLEKARAIAY